MRSSGSAAASLNLNNAWPNCLSEGTDLHPAALFEEIQHQDRALIAGISAYRQDDYVRALSEPPAIWEEGESRVLDYGGTGTPVLFVPSLINRAYILDLMEGASMLRWLSGQGLHPYLLDWGWPGEVERQFSLTDYIAGRLERALAAMPGPVVLAGYCMGGLLALAAALRVPARVKALGLLATPWDFHADDPAAARRVAEVLPFMEGAMRFSGTLPIDALNAMFTMVDPYGVADKYRDFAGQDKASPRARRFVAMEDWLADGVPLAAPVAREVLSGWYGANMPALGQWRVAGLAVDPAQLALPAFCAIPAKDRLVPAASARALAARLRQVTVIEPNAGHIGMVAGTYAETSLWRPFAEWASGIS
ncbi:MAG: alpha/beta fold hydrolase [Rhodospirillales bacterium]|nr:alpha/beta fold hydrolase [Rhodospirillales bacterium]